MLTGLADAKMQLLDLITKNFTIFGELTDRVDKPVQYYSTDGLQIDRAKRILKDSWPEFSKATCVFTPSEVLINDTYCAAQYTGE